MLDEVRYVAHIKYLVKLKYQSTPAISWQQREKKRGAIYTHMHLIDGSNNEDDNNNNNPLGSRGPRRFGGPKPFRLVPVSVGQEYDVTIESTSRRGDSGVAKIQGLVVFVAGTKVGDSARIRITKVGSGFATAEKIAAANAVFDNDDDSSIELLSPDAEAETSGDSDE